MKITLDDIEDFVEKEEYQRYGTTTLTMCFLTLKNGIIVTGESACIDPEEFNVEMGEALARSRALNKCWSMFGFALANEVGGFNFIEKKEVNDG